jgi:hypothetical protein
MDAILMHLGRYITYLCLVVLTFFLSSSLLVLFSRILANSKPCPKCKRTVEKRYRDACTFPSITSGSNCKCEKALICAAAVIIDAGARAVDPSTASLTASSPRMAAYQGPSPPIPPRGQRGYSRMCCSSFSSHLLDASMTAQAVDVDRSGRETVTKPM